jgi:hypothetical protein
MFTSGGKWSSDTKCGGERSGGWIDVNGGESKGGFSIKTIPEYPSGGSQGGGHSTGGGSGTSGSSYSSPEQHIQQVCTSLGGNVLGGAYHDGRKNRDSADGINYQVKGIVSQLNYYGFKDPKGIVLSDCALEDRDISLYSSFVQTLQHHPFNLTIIDLSNNKLGIDAVEGLFYLTRVDHVLPKHVQRINLSNNLLDDKCAEHIANYLKQGVHPSLSVLYVLNNHITPIGERFFAQALESVKVTSITIVLTAKNSFKELVNFFKTGFNYYAKEFHIEQIAMDIESQKYLTNCQKTGANAVLGGLTGLTKCFAINKNPYFFLLCTAKEVSTSLLQPETLNCFADIHKFFEHDITSLTGASSDQDIHHQDCTIS